MHMVMPHDDNLGDLERSLSQAETAQQGSEDAALLGIQRVASLKQRILKVRLYKAKEKAYKEPERAPGV